MPKKGEYIKIIIKSPSMIYADFENILVPENNGKQSPEESYLKKYRKDVACSYGYKLVYVDDNFCKTFKYYLDKDFV